MRQAQSEKIYNGGNVSDVRRSDVLILGGGVIGLACALHLLRAGRSVTVLERGGVGGAASHGNCGTITPSHAMPLAMPGMIAQALRWLLKPDAPFRVAPRLDFGLLEWLLQFAHRCNWTDFKRITALKTPLLNLSRQAIEELIRTEKLDCEFEKTGTLNVYRDARAFEHSHWLPRILGESGMPVEVLDGTGCRVLEPALNDSIVGGYFNPLDAHLRPDRYAAELARVVKDRGGQIYESTRIGAFRVAGGQIDAVLGDREEFRGRDVVLALGAWSPLLARELDLRIPIQPGKGYSITYSRPSRCPRIPLTLKERAVCVTGWNSGYRLGSTMEFAGYDSTLNRTRLDALRRGAAEYLHESEGPQVTEEWYGWRPMTYDDLPIIGRAARVRNLVLATGHGMLGVTMSAATGLLVGELICDRPASLDLAPLSPARFNI
ncbi:MAG: FAD-dependent oxidoreductase [Rudaea sp.]|nr:FAD-dependent oxidoreductase [Rudaea sp.]